jgi:hypothetical protein
MAVLKGIAHKCEAEIRGKEERKHRLKKGKAVLLKDHHVTTLSSPHWLGFSLFLEFGWKEFGRNEEGREEECGRGGRKTGGSGSCIFLFVITTGILFDSTNRTRTKPAFTTKAKKEHGRNSSQKVHH